MKRLIALITILSLLNVGVVSASHNRRLTPAYRAVYCYPTGTYWATQVAAFPDYYAHYNAYYTANYGATTRYCI